MAVKQCEYRYVTQKRPREKDSNLHIKEMIEMIKNEEVKSNLYVKNIKLSDHAFSRVKRIYGTMSLATATKEMKKMLSKAVRIGSVLSNDGRINVMYAYEGKAILLSPDLKTVVTINKYENIRKNHIIDSYIKEEINKDEAIKLHFDYIEELEAREKELTEKIINIESNVRENVGLYGAILDYGKGFSRKKKVKSLISEQNYILKTEGRKLFELKEKKRVFCKALASII